jgi:hypothetical protein
MQMLWCWRCKCEMPMMDEAEFAVASSLFQDAMKSAKEVRKNTGVPIQDDSVQERFRPVLAYYERVTGYKETNHNAVMHHRILLYGPPCERCSKPLRTPKAKLCGSCMWSVRGPQGLKPS